MPRMASRQCSESRFAVRLIWRTVYHGEEAFSSAQSTGNPPSHYWTQRLEPAPVEDADFPAADGEKAFREVLEGAECAIFEGGCGDPLICPRGSSNMRIGALILRP